MFCYQCEQTVKGTGCVVAGVCGKDPATAAMQDLLIHVAKGVSMYAHRARGMGAADGDVDLFVIEALFTTVTNVNFDPVRLGGMLKKGVAVRNRAKELYLKACQEAGTSPEALHGPADFAPASDGDSLLRQAEQVSITSRISQWGNDAASVSELIIYGLKGMAAYADHAHVLGLEDETTTAFFHEALDFISSPKPLTELVAMALKVGEMNLNAMELLDRANTGTYGHPVPTPVRVTPVEGKAIVVSGHDLKDLYQLLEQTEGLGINIYTHGEMLPAHGYPRLKSFPHLVGNYGGAWQDQMREFDEFPGAILMTTNCIQRPRPSYINRIFTSGLVAWPGVAHISDGNFKPVIEAALAATGFARTEPEKTITVGFGRNAVLSVADKVIEAVKQGKLRHFYLIGGCDGAKPGRNYFTEFAQATPDDTIILTLACGKFRFNKIDFGTVAGLPRLLDIGQCNDAYSAIQIAAALANAFGTDVNGLPLSLILSWYEQKAVAILLTLLHLGIKNIRLGPTLPAFVTPSVLNVLVEQFNLMPVGNVQEDLAATLSI